MKGKSKESSSKESRRTRIVQAAIECFIESGVAQTTMSQVARKAKVDQPLIHYYFPSFESLYQEVFLVVLQSLKEASLAHLSGPSIDPVQSLTRYIEAPFRWALQEPGLFSIWMYFYYLASYHPEFEKLNSQIRQTGRERITVMIYSGIEEKVFALPPGISVRAMALTIQGMITGNTIMMATQEGRDPSMMEMTVKSCLSLLGYKKK